MARPEFHRRIEAHVRRAREESAARLIDVADFSGTAMAPVTVRLEAGQKAVAIPIESKAPVGQTQSWVLVATSAPGVVVRLAQNNTTVTCRANGWLCRPEDGVFDVAGQSGAVTPAFETLKWLNHSNSPAVNWDAVRAALVNDPEGNFAQQVIETVSVGDDPTDFHSVARYYWGRDAHIDLGNEGDGKIFSFWVRNESTLITPDGSSSGILFRCRPYDETETDAESEVGTDGTPSDTQFTRDGFTGGYFSYSGQRYYDRLQLTDRWQLISLDKKYFVNNSNGLWSRVTAFEVSHVFADNNGGAGYKSWFSSVYFGDPPWSQVDAVALIPWRSYLGRSAVLSLDAPADSDCVVEAMVMLK